MTGHERRPTGPNHDPQRGLLGRIAYHLLRGGPVPPGRRRQQAECRDLNPASLSHDVRTCPPMSA
jgi:hypothetical protein